MTVDESDRLAERFEAHRTHLRLGGLPDAGLARRGRRRRRSRPGRAEPVGHRPRRHAVAMLAYPVSHGKIVEIGILADPDRIRGLGLGLVVSR